MEVSGQLYAPASLPPETNCSIPLNTGWIGPRTSLGDFGEYKNLLPLPEFETQTVHPQGNFNYSCQLSHDHRSGEIRFSSAVENCRLRTILVKSVMWINQAAWCRRNAVNVGFGK